MTRKEKVVTVFEPVYSGDSGSFWHIYACPCPFSFRGPKRMEQPPDTTEPRSIESEREWRQSQREHGDRGHEDGERERVDSQREHGDRGHEDGERERVDSQREHGDRGHEDGERERVDSQREHGDKSLR